MKSKLLIDLRKPHPNIQCDNEFVRWMQMLRSPGRHAVVVYRFGSWLQRKPIVIRALLFPVYLFFDHRMRSKWGIEIHRLANIGAGFSIEHYGGIFIGWNASIGENCTIFHDVTFSMVFTGPRKGTPAIGNNVIIYPGAKLIGRVVVGNNAIIGPNVVLTRDVPDNGVIMVQQPQTVPSIMHNR
jgi:serine O-acetyltransferase